MKHTKNELHVDIKCTEAFKTVQQDEKEINKDVKEICIFMGTLHSAWQKDNTSQRGKWKDIYNISSHPKKF